jgi:hypothetical protein
MSSVMVVPEFVGQAAGQLESLGAELSAAHAAATAPTTGIVAAARDEVSAAIAGLFSQHAQQYQARAGQATAFHEQFVQHLTASAHSYAATEAANAAFFWGPRGGPLSVLRATGIPNDINSSTLVQSLGQSLQSLRDLYSTLPGPQQNLINGFLFVLIGLPLDLGLFILAAPIIIPLLPILILAGAA